MSKLLASILFAGVAIVGLAPAANAAQAAGGAVALHQSSALPIIQADHRCGPGRHYVFRHRYHGRWINSYCTRDFHRRPMRHN
jgi:hypothetical protein